MDALSQLANSNQPLPARIGSRTDGFSRNQVVAAFHEAFLLIGGVNRLTLWAHENPTEFFKLYAKLLPATTINLGDNGKLTIEHTIGKTALDQHEIIDVAIESMTENQVVEVLNHTHSQGV